MKTVGQFFSLLVCAAWTVITPAARAGGSALSLDGRRVYSADYDDKADLDELDIDAGTLVTRHLQLPQGSQDIVALATAQGGRLCVLTPDRLWMWDPKSGAAEASDAAPKGTRFIDVACHVRTGRIVLTAAVEKPEAGEDAGRVLFKENAARPAMAVFVRRIDRVECPVFLADGTLLFGCEGDLWHGVIEPDTDGENRPRGVLSAYRYAPLATRETYSGTPMQTGVKELAVSRDKIYAHVRRMGGSGWGDLVRLDRPKLLKEGTEFNLATGFEERLKIHRRALGSVEWLQDHPSRSFLSGSPDERRVHFAGPARVENGVRKGDRRHYLIERDGAMDPLKAVR